MGWLVGFFSASVLCSAYCLLKEISDTAEKNTPSIEASGEILSLSFSLMSNAFIRRNRRHHHQPSKCDRARLNVKTHISLPHTHQLQRAVPLLIIMWCTLGRKICEKRLSGLCGLCKKERNNIFIVRIRRFGIRDIVDG